jgi:hypothetical protein
MAPARSMGKYSVIRVVCGDRMEVVGWDGLIHCDELGLISGAGRRGTWTVTSSRE